MTQRPSLGTFQPIARTRPSLVKKALTTLNTYRLMSHSPTKKFNASIHLGLTTVSHSTFFNLYPCGLVLNIMHLPFSLAGAPPASVQYQCSLDMYNGSNQCVWEVCVSKLFSLDECRTGGVGGGTLLHSSSGEGTCRLLKKDVIPNCKRPFNRTSGAACFEDPILPHLTITSPECAAAYTRMFNFSDDNPLIRVSAVLNSIQRKCSASVTQVCIPLVASLHAQLIRTP